MQRRIYYQAGGGNNPFGSILSLLFMVLFFVGLFYLANFIFKILWWVAPVLLIVTLIIDYKVVTNYLKWVGSSFRRNWFFGILLGLFTVLGFPLVTAILFFKALFKRKVKQAQDEYEAQTKGTLIDYEEVDSEQHITIELPPSVPPKEKEPKDSRYDDLFE
ncbi:MAG: hypothetical protein KDC24_08290 [Saprospiraceae bacterium]|nr:hypothetical protein [Saprospiraceae bacterium]